MSFTANVTFSPPKLKDLRVLIEERIIECKERVKQSKKGLNLNGDWLTKYAAQTARTTAVKDMALLRLISDVVELYITEEKPLVLSALGARGLDRLVFPRRKV